MKQRLSQMKGIVWRLSGMINIGAFSSHSCERILFNRETELKPSRQGRSPSLSCQMFFFRGQLSPSNPGPPPSSASHHPTIYHHYPPPPKAARTCLQCVRGIIVMRLCVGSLAAKVGGLFAGQHRLPRSSCSSCSSWEPHWRADRTLVSLTAASAWCRAEKRGQTTDEEPRRAWNRKFEVEMV